MMTVQLRGTVEGTHRIGRVVPGDDHVRPTELDVGAVLLGMTAGVQLMLTAMLLSTRTLDPTVAGQLTVRGLALYRPEYDLPLYAVGCLVSLALALGLGRYRRPDAGPVRPVMLAVLATFAFLVILARTPSTPGTDPTSQSVPLIAPGAIAVLAFLGGGRGARAGAGLVRGRSGRWMGDEAKSSLGGEPTPTPGWLGIVADVTAAVLIVLLVAVPSASRLAGRIATLEDIPFYHWDFFVMGPTLRYLHGGALGTDIYSQYGVAWPIIFAGLSPWLSLTYGNVLAVSLGCGVLYFLGLFLGLRLFLKSAMWASAGTVLAIFVQMHIGVIPQMTIWLTPSSSVLRTPLDVWFFLALWLHLGSGRKRWMALAGILAGLAILFETDTGLFLAASLGFALVCLPGCPTAFATIRDADPAKAVRLFLERSLLAGTALVITVLVGLTIASRGTLLRAEFWSGWLEPLRLYAGGVSAMPVRTSDGLAGLCWFLAMATTYLTLVGLLLAAVPARRISRGLLLGGCVSAYGLCLLLQYINRSHPFNIYHAAIPFCAVITGLAGLAVERWASRTRVAAWSPRLALGLAVLLLVTGSGFRAYPHVWDRLVGKTPVRGVTLLADVRGLPEARRGEVKEFQAVVRQMRSMRLNGTTVAVLDPADTKFYLESGCPPWDRYTSPITQILRKDELAAAEARMTAAGVDCWIAREPRRRPSNWNDVHTALLAHLEHDYVPVEKVGRYRIWRARRIANAATKSEGKSLIH